MKGITLPGPVKATFVKAQCVPGKAHYPKRLTMSKALLDAARPHI
jgi:hypothetical protein